MQVASRNWRKQGSEFSSRASIRNTAVQWLIYSSDTLVSLASWRTENNKLVLHLTTKSVVIFKIAI